MFERVRSRPSHGAGSNARSGCLRGDSEECHPARAVIEPTYVCLCSSSTPPKVSPATIICKCRGTRTGNTVGRHKSQRAPGRPGQSRPKCLDDRGAGRRFGRCRPAVRTGARRCGRVLRVLAGGIDQDSPAAFRRHLGARINDRNTLSATLPWILPKQRRSTSRCRARSHGRRQRPRAALAFVILTGSQLGATLQWHPPTTPPHRRSACIA